MASNDDGSEAPKPDAEFKKPVLIGRMGKLPRKVTPDSEKPVESSSQYKPNENVKVRSAPRLLMRDIPIPYREPKWSGLCPESTEYSLEVLNSGLIVNKMNLNTKPYYVFGRFTNCDVIMTHVSISRHHAVLQYKAFAKEGEPPIGWYLYDVGSTHGTFLNKKKIREHHYVRVKVGHQIKFGTNPKIFIVLGPDFDTEEESDLSVTEIQIKAQNMKIEKDRTIEHSFEQRERDRLNEEKRREEQGIDWGMGDDAEDEDADLSDNPYASTVNEELYLDDPKKTLRGYFEREGLELIYDCEERGVGQYICRVELPMDDVRGKPVIAEVIHRGKKKEAVVACALEACKILDRAGLLRQAKHESRRRRERDWGADDYYDSDEDTFLDRTGNVEKKRQARMEKHGVAPAATIEPMTYEDLIKKVSELQIRIEVEEKNLEQLRLTRKQMLEEMEVDDLDEYMKSLGKQGQSMAEKAKISNAKMSIQKLKEELTKTQRLAEITRPAHLPPIIKKEDTNKMAVKQANAVVYGKRIKLKEDLEKKPKEIKEIKQEDEEFVEEMDSDEEAGLLQDEKVKEEEFKDISESDEKVKEEEFKDISESDEKVKEEESKDISESDEKVKDEEFKDISESDEKVKEEEFKDISESDEKVMEEEFKDISESDEKVKEEESKDITDSDEKVKEESKDISESDEKVKEEASKDVSESDEKVKEEEFKDISKSGDKVHKEEPEDITEIIPENVKEDKKEKKIYGPMGPPEGYVVPEGYFEQETDRDLPEIEEKE